MGVPTSEVGYTPAMPRREDQEVHKDMWWHWTKKKTSNISTITKKHAKSAPRKLNNIHLSSQGIRNTM